MSSSCQDIRSDLIECVKLSGCLRTSDFHACLKSDALKAECKLLRTAYFECRRGQLDMRKRMRGNVTRQGESIFNSEEFQSSSTDSNSATVNNKNINNNSATKSSQNADPK